MQSFQSKIYDIFNGTYAYIYIWVSKTKKTVYVGQTNASGGVYKRGAEHLSRGGTLRERFYFSIGENLENVTDWQLLSFRLPNIKKFTSAESSFRLAVEYYVQSRLHEKRGNFFPPFKIISRVTYNDYCSKTEVITIGENILLQFEKYYYSG